jgi:hypothetical protein
MEETSDTSFTRRRPVPILDRNNYEEWFMLMELYLQGQETWTAIEVVDQKSTEWAKRNASALYTILISIGDADKELIKGVKVAQAVWKKLTDKYNKQLPSQGRQHLYDFVTYQKTEDVTVQDALVHLQNLARKIGASRPKLKDVFDQGEILQQLLAALPSEYSGIRDGFDSQVSIDVDTALTKLQEKESQLKQEQAALATSHQKQQKYRPTTPPHKEHGGGQSKKSPSWKQAHHYRNSGSSPKHRKDRPPSPYYTCGRNYYTRNCKYVKAAKTASQTDR